MAQIKVPVAKRFVPAKYDTYGTRKAPAMGFVVHMAEGNNVAAYLSKGNIARGVSVHFTVEANGEIVQMMNLSRISGSINPQTLRTDDDKNGYYGASHGKHVLGSWYNNPNNAVISVETAGKAVNGPNEKQIASLIELFLYLRTKYPNIKPLGHRDFQNVKRCPGNTAAIRKAFKGMGGHGKDFDPVPDKPKPEPATGDDMIIKDGVPTSAGWTVALAKGTDVFESTSDTKALLTVDAADSFEYYGHTRDGKWLAIEIQANLIDGSNPRVIAYVKKTASTKPKPKPVAPDAQVKQLEDQIRTQQDKLNKIKTAATSAGVAVDNAADLVGKLESLLA